MWSRIIEYLSVIQDDIENLDNSIISNILRDELGKQKYNQLNDLEKKVDEIKKSIEKTSEGTVQLYEDGSKNDVTTKTCNPDIEIKS